MVNLNLQELFPNNQTVLIFVGYMALFINLGQLITASKNEDGKLEYNPVTVVLMTETTKLLLAIGLYLRELSWPSFVAAVKENRIMAVKYFAPAFLYAMYNILTYYNLETFDPTTYFLLLQFRVVVTGVVWQILFQVKLSVTQWAALVLLTFGCILKQYNFSSDQSLDLTLDVSILLLGLQVLCSCLAGVYNEYLLKGHSGDVHLMVQNFFMYSNSMIINLILLGFRGQLGEAFTSEAFSTILNWKVLTLIVNNAAIGIVTSLFLKKLNSILKTFASALELLFTAILSWIFFGIPLTVQTLLAIFIVSAAIVLYAQSPRPKPAAAAATVSKA